MSRVRVRVVRGRWRRGMVAGARRDIFGMGRMDMVRTGMMVRKARIWWGDVWSFDCWGLSVKAPLELRSR